MPEVLRRVPNAKLILAIRHDDLHYERELQSLARDLRLEDHIEFRFNVSEDEKRQLLRASRVLAVPSTVEGFGIVVLEANACGVPAVASSGVPEGSVRDHFNGLRYPYGQIHDLSNALVTSLSDDGLWAQLSSNAAGFAKEFAWRSIGARFEGIVQSTVARASKVASVAPSER
jgi:glycosyltransferase involved in cell wall biosynthesis